MVWMRKGYRFGFNGQMKTNEIAGTGNHNTALFWEYDARLGRRWNLDPKPTVGISDYATFRNNPELLTDFLGDKVDVAKIYEKKNGKFINEKGVRDFELFASTDGGKKFLLDHAQKGFTLKGEIVKDLNIEAKEEGNRSKAGIDVSYSYKNGGNSSTTSPSFEDGRLKIDIAILSSEPVMKDEMQKTNVGIYRYIHESLLHGIEQGNRYLSLKSNYKFKPNEESRYNVIGESDHNIYVIQHTYYWRNGEGVLKQANDKAVEYKILKHPASSEFISDLIKKASGNFYDSRETKIERKTK